MTSSSLKQAVGGLVFLALPALSWAGQSQPAASPFVGEYFVTENRNDICVPYTRNLNQFRRMDFDVCHPRLSEKYPEFTRPVWDEIPFDLALVEQIVKNGSLSPEDGDAWWQAWLKASEALRAGGRLKLWRTRIDVDNDGALETILRLDNPFTTKVGGGGEKGWAVDQNSCAYRNGRLYMLESSYELPARKLSADPEGMKKGFNLVAPRITDILHFAGGRVVPGAYNGYYGVDWRLGLPSSVGRRIGATRGLTVFALFNMGAGECCLIDWVPTGQYRPLKRGPR
jgi:hypothetical protein